jgi:BlaI family penicillinase repressor
MARKNVTPEPTDSELAILQVLWRRGPSSVREVWEELGQDTGYTTVLKFLQIMLAKNLVHRNEGSITHIYKAAVTETGTQERLVKELMNRVFGGSASQLVLRALSAEAVSPAEREKIRTLLNEQKKEKT